MIQVLALLDLGAGRGTYFFLWDSSDMILLLCFLDMCLAFLNTLASLSSSEKHDILLRNLHEHLRQKPIDCVIAKYCFIHSLRFVHMMNNEPLPDNYMKIFLHEWNEIKRKM